MPWQRILAVFLARTREFYRDRAGLGWNILMPFLLLFAFAVIFSAEPQPLFKIGIIGDPGADAPVSRVAHVQRVSYADLEEALPKVQQHQIDLLLDLSQEPRYWVNVNSPQGEVVETLLLDSYRQQERPPPRKQSVEGQALRYVDWVLPGILAMNIMFSCFWGVGWVIVRYRKNGVLRRLQATPLTALEFLSAQVLSRILVVMAATLVVFLGADLLLDFTMHGSYLALFAVFIAGALCMISLGLLVASRIRTEELADGLLNMLSWPMMLLSGVWFSMEGTGEFAQTLSQLMPLTYLVDAARAVMLDGAGIVELLPQVGLMLGIGLLLLGLAAVLFRWD
jgi:ABC-type multidrug transport system permease subunit